MSWWAAEVTWEYIATLVDKKGKIEIEIEVDNVQDVGMHGSAKAGGGVKLDELTDEATALRQAIRKNYLQVLSIIYNYE